MVWQNALGSTGLGFATNLVQSLQMRDMNLIGTQMAGIMEIASAMNPMVRDLENQAQMAMFQQMEPNPWPNFGLNNWSGGSTYNTFTSSKNPLTRQGVSRKSMETPTVSYSLASLFSGFFSSGAGQSIKKGSVLEKSGSSFAGSSPVTPYIAFVPMQASTYNTIIKTVSPPPLVNVPTAIPKPVKVVRFLDGTSHTLMSNGKIYEKDAYGNSHSPIDTNQNKVTYSASGLVESVQYEESYTGNSILEYSDGTQEVTEKNGIFTLKNKYGTAIFTAKPGDTILRNSDGRILLSKRFDEQSGALTTTYANGTTETLSADGRLTHKPQGSYMQTFDTLKDTIVRGVQGEFIRGIKVDAASQQEITLFRDGSSESKNKDDKITVTNSYGQQLTTIDTKKSQITRNEEGKILFSTSLDADKEITRFVDGSTETKDPDGKIAVSYKSDYGNYGGFTVDTRTEKVTRGKDGKILYTESEDTEKKTHTKRFLDSKQTTETTDASGKITISYSKDSFKESKTIDTKKEAVIRDDKGKIIASSSTGADAAEPKK